LLIAEQWMKTNFPSVTTSIIETASRIKQYFEKANCCHHDDSHTPPDPLLDISNHFDSESGNNMFFGSFRTTDLVL
jgi:hypothetical protein